MLLDVHSNIALDWPTATRGFIYTTENITELLSKPEFQEQINSGQLYGAFGIVELHIKPEQASHIVRKVYISEDGELKFSVEPLDNQSGRELIAAANSGLILAKLSLYADRTVINGKLKVHNFWHVHIVVGGINESVNSKKD